MKDKLLKLFEYSYSPYSNFRVAAIVVTKDGNEFAGVNIENASFGATICAERCAICNAIAHGYKKYDFEKIYVMCDSDKKSTCCMLCRQVIIEFFETNKEVICMNRLGDMDKYLVSELCPYPFVEGDLK